MSTIEQKILDQLIRLNKGLVGDIPTTLLDEFGVFTDRITVSKGTAFTTNEQLIGNCNLIIVSTTGASADVSFRVMGPTGKFSDEYELRLQDYWIGYATRIDLINDAAEAGTNIFVDFYLAPISLLNAIKRSFITGTIIAKPQLFYAAVEDFTAVDNEFETDQPLGTTPTLSFPTTPATAQYARIDTIRYQLTPTNAVTYQLYLLEDNQANDENSQADVFFDSGAAQASGTIYIQVAGGSTSKLPITINLRDIGTVYYLVDWSAAPGDTTGYVRVYGEVLF